jgi:hypothetical protein
MGSPATTYIFNQRINEVYNGEHEVQRVREFYTLGHLLSDYAEISKFSNRFKDNEQLYNFLSWNYSAGGFWGKLQKMQPDLLILDLFPEIFFGNLKLNDDTYVTRNIRLMKHTPHDTEAITFNNEEFFNSVLRSVEQFTDKVSITSPKTKIIFNGARFPERMSKFGIIQNEYDGTKYHLSMDRIRSYNRAWQKLDDMLEAAGYDVTSFDQKNSAAELHFPTGKNWYYLYNQNYYTDVQSQIEAIAQRYNLGPTIKTLPFEDEVEDLTEDVVLLDVPSQFTDLRVFRKNHDARARALKIAAQDYVLHGNAAHKYRFVKRQLLKTQYPKFEDVHYRLTPPKEATQYWDNRLLVRMFGFSLPYRTSIIERNFRLDFQTLKDSVVKNTYILEIGDINLIAGSFYSNTTNYPDYESQIQRLVAHIAEQYQISPENIVFYGTSRGATGALLNAAQSNAKMIVADPVIDDTAWYNENDIHFVDGVRDIDLTARVTAAMNAYQRTSENAIVLGSSNVGVTFAAHLRLPIEKFTLIDLQMAIYDHGSINGKSVPIQLSYINQLLISSSVKEVRTLDDVADGGVIFEVKHLMKKSIHLESVQKYRIRLSDDQFKGSLEDELTLPGFHYSRKDDEFLYFERESDETDN